MEGVLSLTYSSSNTFQVMCPSDLSLKIVLMIYQPTTQSRSPSILLKDNSLKVLDLKRTIGY